MAPILFCMGNPLLDMQVVNGEELLEKYDLKANDAILAEAKHAPIYEEVVKDYKVTYVAGGAAQNSARGAAYVLPPGSVAYTGCVGDDDLADQLRAANKKEGLQEVYLTKAGQKTGACAVVITGHHRSLVTDLRSSEKFEISHLDSPEVKSLIDSAKAYYVEGYFLTHGLESTLKLAKQSTANKKTFVMNLSAPFIPQFFTAQVKEVLPFVDIVIGNESEAEAFGTALGLENPKDLATVAKAIASYPKENAEKPRSVVITQGPESTLAVSEIDPEAAPKTYPVDALDASKIVDTNGAGDAFAGGFVGAYVSGKSFDECIEAGHKLGTMCVQQVGPQYASPKVKIFS